MHLNSCLLNISFGLVICGSNAQHLHRNEMSVDVAIVGAGLAGLSAARDLTAAKKTVVVLEARDRVGGRVENQLLDNGGVIELGAAFVGPTQDRVLALAEELGLETFLEYNTGANVLWSHGQRTAYTNGYESIPSLTQETLLQLGTALSELDSMAAEIDTQAPWSHQNAFAWDSMTFASWLDVVTPLEDVRTLIDEATTSIFSAEPSELSLLYTLAYIAAAGNQTAPGTFERLIGVVGGAQESRIVGGTGLLAHGIAAKLGSEKVMLSAAVHTIIENSSGYEIRAGNQVVIAKHIVVAMSPPLAARITYVPPLPAERDHLTQRMFMGSLGKAIAVYETPFWRQAVSDSGIARTTFDVSPSNGSYGAILGFIEADQMRLLDNATEAHIQALVTQDYVKYFGPQAAHATQWVFKRWDNDIFARGGPVALGGPGTLTKYGSALTKPFRGIHWAGTETSPYWTGYMDGAVRSGERVAKEITAAME
ncbi:hypothetical protein LTR09_012522 [Extremus antarcticus]|uniref:Amine oxidase n=1 Tax=Extremus antarcticus TaxID=702011 RepID=A0AAJ0D500_9PEZI|nr:hypothetical protein LTR09_012522 [Extremus antarcticus]